MRLPIRQLLQKLTEAKKMDLIADVTNYNTCEINSYIVIVFHRKTSNQTKDVLMKHIETKYDDVLHLHLSAFKTRLFIEYDDWEMLPKHVAF